MAKLIYLLVNSKFLKVFMLYIFTPLLLIGVGFYTFSNIDFNHVDNHKPVIKETSTTANIAQAVYKDNNTIPTAYDHYKIDQEIEKKLIELAALDEPDLEIEAQSIDYEMNYLMAQLNEISNKHY